MIWSESEPPKDGTPIVAVGSIASFHADGGCDVRPFVGSISWKPWGDGFGCWLGLDGLSFEWTTGETLSVHWWAPMPPEKGGIE